MEMPDPSEISTLERIILCRFALKIERANLTL